MKGKHHQPEVLRKVFKEGIFSSIQIYVQIKIYTYTELGLNHTVAKFAEPEIRTPNRSYIFIYIFPTQMQIKLHFAMLNV